ncbi:MAG: hypothetical protein IPM74_05270 [Crocinitomicaceae bacterium]|nr:hypothetical protein [Crocinitomicaceae bacterium]MBK8925313.1 hypothetical protein [Crocinitomicaceae bacterium]
MRRQSAFFILAFIFLLPSCEKCKKCSYSFTVTTIEQTLNGEQEVTTTYSNQILYVDDTVKMESQCIKPSDDEEFTIEQHYQNKKDTTSLDNFTFTCTDI